MLDMTFVSIGAAPEVISLYNILAKESLVEEDFTELGHLVLEGCERRPEQAELITADAILSLWTLCNGDANAFMAAYKSAFSKNQWAEQDAETISEALMLLIELRSTLPTEYKRVFDRMTDLVSKLAADGLIQLVLKRRFLDTVLRSSEFKLLQPIIQVLTGDLAKAEARVREVAQLCSAFSEL